MLRCACVANFNLIFCQLLSLNPIGRLKLKKKKNKCHLLWLYVVIVSVHQIHSKNNMQSARIVPSVAVKLHLPHLLQKENNIHPMNLKILLGRIIHIYEKITAWVESRGLFLWIKWNLLCLYWCVYGLGLTKTCQWAVSYIFRLNSTHQQWNLRRTGNA